MKYYDILKLRYILLHGSIGVAFSFLQMTPKAAKDYLRNTVRRMKSARERRPRMTLTVTGTAPKAVTVAPERRTAASLGSGWRLMELGT